MNRRRFARVRASLRFTFLWEDQLFLFRTTDVSASGARLEPHEAGGALPPVGAVGRCGFLVDGADVESEARVVRHLPQGLAVRFQGLPRAMEDKLVAFVFRLEAQALSRRLPV